jgi:hypothetical protein
MQKCINHVKHVQAADRCMLQGRVVCVTTTAVAHQHMQLVMLSHDPTPAGPCKPALCLIAATHPLTPSACTNDTIGHERHVSRVSTIEHISQHGPAELTSN